ncbi:MAG TPA: SdpI family protein [Desulfomonilaceae bacterium]|nr:SdpI family protein [Desulfomonilaceae bacterium]
MPIHKALTFRGEFTPHLFVDFGSGWGIHPDLTTNHLRLFLVDANRILLYHRTFGHSNVSGLMDRQPDVAGNEAFLQFLSARGFMESVNVKTAVTLVGLGIVVILVSIPLLLGKIKMNCAYGFRIRKAFESEENWYTINRYGSKALMCWGVCVMILGISCLFVAPQSVLTVAKLTFLSVIVPIIQTLRYARRL